MQLQKLLKSFDLVGNHVKPLTAGQSLIFQLFLERAFFSSNPRTGVNYMGVAGEPHRAEQSPFILTGVAFHGC
jgi:hypothetical protein